MKNNAKHQVVTFKADDSLIEAIEKIPNKSEFIRNAILAALDNTCPLCNGSGSISPNQKRHWDNLMADHRVEECNKCHESFIVCSNRSRRKAAHRG